MTIKNLVGEHFMQIGVTALRCPTVVFLPVEGGIKHGST